jgi:RHS repeat-associated protein
VPNTPEAASKLQRLVVNRLRAQDFEEAGAWRSGNIGGQGAIIYDVNERMMGRKSLCVQKDDAAGTTFAERMEAAAPGTYTFSAYAKTEEDTWAWLEISYVDAGRVERRVCCPKRNQLDEFTRLQCTITLPEDAARQELRCRVAAGGAVGKAWFDCAQLEEGPVANHYNLLREADFSRAGELTGWQTFGGTQAEITDAEPGIPAFLGGKALRITGSANQRAYVFQELLEAGLTGDSYVMGGWARAESARGRTCRARVLFRALSDGEWYEGGAADWNDGWVGWQYCCGGAVAPADYDRVRVNIEYDENVNCMQVGAVSLTREEYGPTFARDDKNNVTAVRTLLGTQSSATYDKFDNLIAYVKPGHAQGSAYTVYYGETDEEKKQHLPLRSRTPLGITSENSYDSYGNPVASQTGHTDEHGAGITGAFIRGETAYTANGNYVAGNTDARGKTVSTVTDADLGVVSSVTDPAGQTVAYAYDGANRMTDAQAVAGGKTYRNEYTYENDWVAAIRHNTTNDTPDVTYTFGRDALGNPESVSVGERLLSRNHYSETGDKQLAYVAYGNGGAVRYTYDSFRRVTGIRYDDAQQARFTYEYAAHGGIAAVRDAELSRTARLGADAALRPVTAELWEGDTLQYQLTQRYNEVNLPGRLREQVQQDDGLRGVYDTACAYDLEDRPTAVTYRSSQTKEPGEDRDGRLYHQPAPDEAGELYHRQGEAGATPLYGTYHIPPAARPIDEATATRRLTYTYDALGRPNQRVLKDGDQAGSAPVAASTYQYAPGGFEQNGVTSTTGLIGQMQVNGLTYNYTYDDVGNIVSEQRLRATQGEESGGPGDPLPIRDEEDHDPLRVEENGERLPARVRVPGEEPRRMRPELATGYAYDPLGQLTRVNDERANQTWAYDYDRGGNLLEKRQYAYTTETGLTNATPEQTIPYTYGDEGWKDLLTAYGEKAITYDAIGNPLTYDGWAYTWKAGRMLHSMTKGSTAAQFTYDHTGLRVKKSVNGVDTLYTMNGKKITHVKKGKNGATDEDAVSMHFYYDAQGRPTIIRCNGVDYAYLHNLQGDVVAIVDMEGQIVVEYGYDAWGRPVALEGSMAATLGRDNPFRYRGYVWDEETGLYVTATRYYNPEWGRWLNADTLLGTTGALLSHNLFAYCLNNPVNRADHSGNISALAIFLNRIRNAIKIALHSVDKKGQSQSCRQKTKKYCCHH